VAKFIQFDPLHAYAWLKANLLVNRVLFVGLAFAIWDWWSALLVLGASMLIANYLTKSFYYDAMKKLGNSGPQDADQDDSA